MFQPNATLTEKELADRRLYQESFWQNIHIKESILNQKSSYRWLRRDIVTQDFFSCVYEGKE